MYKIVMTKRSVKELEKIRKGDKKAHARIVEAVQGLKIDPFPQNSRPLKGQGERHRLRVGEYRVIYVVHQERLELILFRVAPRGGVYKG